MSWTLKLPEIKFVAAIDRGVFSHRSSRKHEFVAEGGRDRAASFKQSFQMGLGCLLKTQYRLPAVASMGVTTGKRSGLGDPHAIFVSPRLNFRNGDDHTEGDVNRFCDGSQRLASELCALPCKSLEVF
jgi:hypothetical protein